jgi:hypothetical protein
MSVSTKSHAGRLKAFGPGYTRIKEMIIAPDHPAYFILYARAWITSYFVTI